TRESHWAALPHHATRRNDKTTFTIDEPCGYRDNGFERYYPVRTADGGPEMIYGKYKEMADSLQTIDFIGRCGTYRYLDMDQVINQSLQHVSEWISRNPLV